MSSLVALRKRQNYNAAAATQATQQQSGKTDREQENGTHANRESLGREPVLRTASKMQDKLEVMCPLSTSRDRHTHAQGLVFT